ncbi:MAG: hypothetical protein AB7S81_01565 [Bdellovibrionales bacterium]
MRIFQVDQNLDNSHFSIQQCSFDDLHRYTIGTDCAEATGLCLSSELWNHIVDAGTASSGLMAFVMKEAKDGGG